MAAENQKEASLTWVPPSSVLQLEHMSSHCTFVGAVFLFQVALDHHLRPQVAQAMDEMLQIMQLVPKEKRMELFVGLSISNCLLTWSLLVADVSTRVPKLAF